MGDWQSNDCGQGLLWLHGSSSEKTGLIWSSIKDLSEEQYQKEMKALHGKDPDLSLTRQANSSAVEMQRRKGIYVDTSGDAVMSSPFDVTIDDAALWVERAKFADFLLAEGRYLDYLQLRTVISRER